MVVFRVLSGGLGSRAPPLPPALETHAPSLKRQRLAWAHTDDRAQSAEELATQAPSFMEHVPSSLQRAECWQSALDVAAQAPAFSPHLPSLSQALELLHDSAVATQRPSL